MLVLSLRREAVVAEESVLLTVISSWLEWRLSVFGLRVKSVLAKDCSEEVLKKGLRCPLGQSGWSKLRVDLMMRSEVRMELMMIRRRWEMNR